MVAPIGLPAGEEPPRRDVGALRDALRERQLLGYPVRQLEQVGSGPPRPTMFGISLAQPKAGPFRDGAALRCPRRCTSRGARSCSRMAPIDPSSACTLALPDDDPAVGAGQLSSFLSRVDEACPALRAPAQDAVLLVCGQPSSVHSSEFLEPLALFLPPALVLARFRWFYDRRRRSSFSYSMPRIDSGRNGGEQRLHLVPVQDRMGG